MCSILIADDHEIFRLGLRTMLSRRHDLDICGEVTNGREAIDMVVALSPDLLILEIALTGANGIDVIRQIAQLPNPPEILVLTMLDSERMVRAALQAGALGYVLKSDPGQRVMEAIESLLNHQPYFSGEVAGKVLVGYLELGSSNHENGATNGLTDREREVIQLLAEGRSNRIIAEQLSISIKTVETHRAAVMRKLELESIADLVRYAIRNDLISP